MYWLYFLILCILDTVAFGTLIQVRLPLPGLSVSPLGVSLWYKTNQSRVHTHSHLHYQTHTLSQYSPCPKSPQGYYQTTRDHYHSPESTKIFKISNPKFTQCTYPGLPLPSQKTSIKTLDHALPSP